jgi:hypothetical protein
MVVVRKYCHVVVDDDDGSDHTVGRAADNDGAASTGVVGLAISYRVTLLYLALE